MEYLALVLGSTVIASIIGATVTSIYNRKNQQELRDHELKKLYFEKAYEGYQHFDKYILGVIDKYRSLEVECNKLLDQVSNTESYLHTDKLIDTGPFKMITNPLPKLENSALGMFISLEEVKPKSLEIASKEFNETYIAIGEFKLQVRHHKKPSGEIAISLLEKLRDSSEQLVECYENYLSASHRLFKEKFSF